MVCDHLREQASASRPDQSGGAPEGGLREVRALDRQVISAWLVHQHFKVTYASREDNHYSRLIDLARRKGKKVYALEEISDLFFIFRYGEDPFGRTSGTTGGLKTSRWAEGASFLAD